MNNKEIERRKKNYTALIDFLQKSNIPVDEGLDLACVLIIEHYKFSSQRDQYNFLGILGQALMEESKHCQQFDLRNSFYVENSSTCH